MSSPFIKIAVASQLAILTRDTPCFSYEGSQALLDINNRFALGGPEALTPADAIFITLLSAERMLARHFDRGHG